MEQVYDLEYSEFEKELKTKAEKKAQDLVDAVEALAKLGVTLTPEEYINRMMQKDIF